MPFSKAMRAVDTFRNKHVCLKIIKNDKVGLNEEQITKLILYTSRIFQNREQNKEGSHKKISYRCNAFDKPAPAYE